MPAGLIGRKLGMTRIFGDDGSVVPVSVIEATPNSITRLRTPERDGYAALQVGAGYEFEPRLTARLTDQGARLPLGPAVWGDTHVRVPEDLPGPLTHAFTGARPRIERRAGGPVLLVGRLLEAFPVALLAREEHGG